MIMAFSNEWDEQYKNNHHMSIWPWSDLVSSIYRYANPKNGYKRVLELGCGAGANIPLFCLLTLITMASKAVNLFQNESLIITHSLATK
ncbi:hypothetical protein ACTFBV_20625 [Aeromonas rivipollensis]